MDRKRSVRKSSSPNKSNNNSSNTNNNNTATTKTTKYPVRLGDKARSSKGPYPPPPPPRFSPSLTTITPIKAFVVIVIAFVGLVIVINHLNVSRSSQSPREDAFSQTTEDNGGWRRADSEAVRRLDTSTCNIDRVPVTQLDPDRFEREYRFKRPVIVTFPNGARDWTDPEKWTVDSLKRSCGKWKIKFGGPTDIVLRSGVGDVTSSFDKFLDHMMEERGGIEAQSSIYMSDKTFYRHSHLPKTFTLPPYFSNDDELNLSIFFLGASGSGLIFHNHADTWNAVVYGRKRWFIYPITHTPPGGVFFAYPMLDWYERVYPNLTPSQRPLECVQQGGEILYLPESFYHATINMGDTIAVTLQARMPSTEVQKLIEQLGNVNSQLVSNSFQRADFQDMVQTQLDTYWKLLELIPENSQYTMQLGEFYSNLGYHDKAVKMLRKAVKMDPFFVMAYISLSDELEKMGRLEEAEAAVTHALKLSPKWWLGYLQYSRLLIGKHKYDEAIQILRKGTDLNPTAETLWSSLKTAQENTGDTEGARETHEKIDKLRQRFKNEKGQD